MKFPILFTIVVAIVSACTVNPYKATNKVYKGMAKDLATTIRENPLPTGADSVPAAPYWVGTTNFNLRKPNFVIIHHTAQNSCPQTLRTFTTASTQVSAHYVICRRRHSAPYAQRLPPRLAGRGQQMGKYHGRQFDIHRDRAGQ
ncbi:hypothetical protein ACQ86N_18820 [Puia sp. P3]|uniref:hypothetical protein n=1 Tax=Puia sp. P3 TaxID=3423952 RepID=UPI003D67B0DC